MQHYEPIRVKPNADIRLLRLALIPDSDSVYDFISDTNSVAQPTDNLSPELAGKALSISPWSVASEVKLRISKLRMRFPPNQFLEQHSQWVPASYLLELPKNRLNWFWQSGLIPICPNELSFFEYATCVAENFNVD